MKFTCCITQPVLMILQFNLSSTAALGRAVRNIHTLGCSSAHRDAQREETESGLAVSLFIQYLFIIIILLLSARPCVGVHSLLAESALNVRTPARVLRVQAARSSWMARRSDTR